MVCEVPICKSLWDKRNLACGITRFPLKHGSPFLYFEPNLVQSEYKMKWAEVKT